MTTATLTTTPAAPAERTGRARSILAAGAASAAVGAAAATAVVAVAEAFGVPMEVAESASAAPEHIPLGGYATMTFAVTAVGLLVALALQRWTTRAARTWTIAAVVFTAASFALPHTTSGATTATRLVLDLTHVVAAAVIIPAVARRLDRQP